MSTISPVIVLYPIPASQSALRARIGWVCHSMRIAAVLWSGWGLVTIILNWYHSDPAKMMENLGRALNTDLSGFSKTQVTSFYFIWLCLWPFNVAVAYSIWRLYGTFLQGRIFTVDAAIWMRRMGTTGLVAVLIGIVWGRIALFILTSHAHLPAATILLFSEPVSPAHLMLMLFSLVVIALGHIFKTAAEIADDHARIV